MKSVKRVKRVLQTAIAVVVFMGVAAGASKAQTFMSESLSVTPGHIAAEGVKGGVTGRGAGGTVEAKETAVPPPFMSETLAITPRSTIYGAPFGLETVESKGMGAGGAIEATSMSTPFMSETLATQ